MYYSSYKLRLKSRTVSALFLCFISLISFPSVSSAGIFTNVAEEYHRNGYDAQLKGDYQEALSFYYKAVQIDPDNAQFLNDLGLAYEHAGQVENAEQSYLQSIKTDRQYLPPYTNLGLLYKRQQNYAKAANFLQKRIDLGDPNDSWTQKTREELEQLYDSAPLFKAKFIKAETKRLNLQASEKARQNFKNQMIIANAEYQRGLQLQAANKPLEAVRAFNSSLAFAPENTKVVKARQEAMKQFRKQQVAERTEAAMALLEQGKEEAAKEEFNDILTIIPDQPK